jgi:uncharacterized membrane protein
VGRASRRTATRRVHHPRALAALCYTVPIVPAWLILARERRNSFLRFHAAQAFVFHALIAVGQVAIYVLLLIAGGLIQDDFTALVAAVLAMIFFMSLGIAALILWLQLVADCLWGEAHALPIAGAWAVRLERFSPRDLWARWGWRWRHGAA